MGIVCKGCDEIKKFIPLWRQHSISELLDLRFWFENYARLYGSILSNLWKRHKAWKIEMVWTSGT